VTLKVRFADFTTITRSETRRPATCEAAEIGRRCVALLAKTEAGERPVRLLGVSMHGLETPERHDAAAGDPQLPLGID
jgi:DNA polymerase-4